MKRRMLRIWLSGMLVIGIMQTTAPTITLAQPSTAPIDLGASASQPGVPVHQPAPAELAEPGLPQTQNSKGRPTLAITLAGGGARGAAHIGVLKALEREGLRPDFIAGSSIGAIVGGLYCAGVPLSEIERLFANGEVKHAFLPLPLPIAVFTSTPQYIAKRALGMNPEIGIFTGKRIARLVKQHLPPGMENIEDFKIPFSAISTNLLDTRPVWASKGDAATMIRASASVPLIYHPVLFDGKSLVDGVVTANPSTDTPQAAGADVIVSVKLHSSLDTEQDCDIRKVCCYVDRIISIYLAEIEAKATRDAHVVIEPNVGGLHLYSFDRKSMVKAINAGEEAANKEIPRIKQLMRRAEGTATRTNNQGTQ